MSYDRMSAKGKRNEVYERKDMDWGWDRYERTNWQRPDGCKLYIGHFRSANDPNGWTQTRIKFWAHKPIIAMRTICRSGSDPLEFHNQTIN